MLMLSAYTLRSLGLVYDWLFWEYNADDLNDIFSDYKWILKYFFLYRFRKNRIANLRANGIVDQKSAFNLLQKVNNILIEKKAHTRFFADDAEHVTTLGIILASYFSLFLSDCEPFAELWDTEIDNYRIRFNNTIDPETHALEEYIEENLPENTRERKQEKQDSPLMFLKRQDNVFLGGLLITSIAYIVLVDNGIISPIDYSVTPGTRYNGYAALSVL